LQPIFLQSSRRKEENPQVLNGNWRGCSAAPTAKLYAVPRTSPMTGSRAHHFFVERVKKPTDNLAVFRQHS
jgi:hypothetical protein